jgi:hypothetical protein
MQYPCNFAVCAPPVFIVAINSNVQREETDDCCVAAACVGRFFSKDWGKVGRYFWKSASMMVRSLTIDWFLNFNETKNENNFLN